LLAVDLKPGTNLLLEEAQRFGHGLNAIVDIIHVAEPDPDSLSFLVWQYFCRCSRTSAVRRSRGAHGALNEYCWSAI
jgi:hypothetical protein